MASTSQSACESRNWADMPRELLGAILDRLILIPDCIRFEAVCKSWKLVTSDQHQKLSRSCHRQPPMLLVPAGADDDIYHRRLYSIWEHKLYPHRVQIPPRRRCCGSSHGWWAFAEKETDTSLNFSVTLLNPFSGEKICLPTIMKIPEIEKDYYDPEYFLHKVILSCDPCMYPEDWVVVAIHGMSKVVAFIRAGESSWTYPSNHFFPVIDACFYQGQLYAVDGRYKLVAIDLSRRQDGLVGDGTTALKINTFIRSPIPVVDGYSNGSYLVELDQDLLLVRRVFPKVGDLLDFETTVGFKVRKRRKQPYDSANAAEWVDVDDLGKFSLFLGITSQFPYLLLIFRIANQIAYTTRMIARIFILILLIQPMIWVYLIWQLRKLAGIMLLIFHKDTCHPLYGFLLNWGDVSPFAEEFIVPLTYYCERTEVNTHNLLYPAYQKNKRKP